MDDIIDVSDPRIFADKMRKIDKEYDNPCIYCAYICRTEKCEKYERWRKFITKSKPNDNQNGS